MSEALSHWWRDILTERRHPQPADEQVDLQLDLFTDNRRTIWHNQAHEALRGLDLSGAEEYYDKIMQARLDDAEIRKELDATRFWRELLARHGETLPHGAQLYQLFAELTDNLPRPLRTALLELIARQMLLEAAPEQLYQPPHFHLGLLYLELRRYSDAERWLARAVAADIRPTGRFLAYRGDALFLLDAKTQARELYREAYVRDPLTIDLPRLADPRLRDLITDLENEVDDPADIIPWLPVWGWLRNLFTLDLNDIISDRARFLTAMAGSETAGGMTQAQLWYEYLRYAEYLRTVVRDDQELVRVRRKMKALHPEMFGHYLKKISGSSYLP